MGSRGQDTWWWGGPLGAKLPAMVSFKLPVFDDWLVHSFCVFNSRSGTADSSTSFISRNVLLLSVMHFHMFNFPIDPLVRHLSRALHLTLVHRVIG